LQLRGINLGNWLVPEGYMFGLDGGPASPREIETFFSELIGPAEAAQFWQAYREAYITEEDIHFLRQTGMNSIRIPLDYKFFIPGNDEGFALLDRVAGWAEKYHMYVVLDLHCAPGGQGISIQKIRAALARAATSRDRKVATYSDDEGFYVWNRTRKTERYERNIKGRSA
jgi:aryl-phospho-beta-D-glucosidase BglC (GH1 family)